MKNFLESFIYNYGIKASIVIQTYKEAYRECKFVSKENDLNFLKETMIEILECEFKPCSHVFIESREPSFPKFLESLIDEDIELTQEELLSTNFTPDQKPQNGGEKNNHKLKVSMLGFDDSEEEENKEELV